MFETESEHLKKDKEYWEERLKLMEACAKNITYNHAVMVFVPPAHLQRMIQAKRVDSSSESRRQYKVEYHDPNNWQPLDPFRTFSHYTAMYGFGGPRPQHLHIVQGSEEYKAKNSRYREFANEQQVFKMRMHDVNDKKTCFGYAKYVHRYDKCSLEWRPVLADKPQEEKGRGLTFNVNYIHTPVKHGGAKPRVVDESLLFAPVAAKIYGSGNSKHHRVLASAKQLKSEGFNDKAITQMLNQQLKSRFRAECEEAEAAGAEEPKEPAPIKMYQVQYELKTSEEVHKKTR